MVGWEDFGKNKKVSLKRAGNLCFIAISSLWACHYSQASDCVLVFLSHKALSVRCLRGWPIYRYTLLTNVTNFVRVSIMKFKFYYVSWFRTEIFSKSMRSVCSSLIYKCVIVSGTWLWNLRGTYGPFLQSVVVLFDIGTKFGLILCFMLML